MKMGWLIVGLLALPAGALDTVIKGDSMELKDQGEVVVFKGSVRLRRGGDTLNANTMQTNKGRDRVSATGNVQLLREVSQNEKLKGYGSNGFYNTQTGEGYLVGGKEQAHMIHNQVISATSTRTVDIYARRFDFAKNDSTAVATGAVYGKSVDPDSGAVYEFWSDQADYSAQQKMVVLTGARRPMVKQVTAAGRRTIVADKITYNLESRDFLGEGQAEAVFEDESKKE